MTGGDYLQKFSSEIAESLERWSCTPAHFLLLPHPHPQAPHQEAQLVPTPLPPLTTSKHTHTLTQPSTARATERIMRHIVTPQLRTFVIGTHKKLTRSQSDDMHLTPYPDWESHHKWASHCGRLQYSSEEKAGSVPQSQPLATEAFDGSAYTVCIFIGFCNMQYLSRLTSLTYMLCYKTLVEKSDSHVPLAGKLQPSGAEITVCTSVNGNPTYYSA